MRTIFLTLSLFAITLLNAQNNVLAEIEAVNATYNSIEGMFTRTQTNVAKGTSVKDEGELFVLGKEQMAQYYNAPSTDLLIINGNEFRMIRGKKSNKFNTDKNNTMRRLRNTLLYCVHGNLTELAAENSAEITVKITKESYEVELFSTKKTPRGYAKIVLHYDLKSKLLIRMQLNEYNGNSTLYEMSNLKTNVHINPDVFKINTKQGPN